jgi:hypothetical protein
LLDQLARHGIGARLLAEFCGHLGATLPEPARARATAEVSRASSRADVVIEGLAGGRVIVVEAKIDAPEGDRQADRLEEDWPEAEHLVFLTVPGTRIPGTATEIERWHALSWSWFADRVTELLDTTASRRSSDRRPPHSQRLGGWGEEVPAVSYDPIPAAGRSAELFDQPTLFYLSNRRDRRRVVRGALHC